jgi:hypothetical protein
MNGPISMKRLEGSAPSKYFQEVLRTGGASDKDLALELRRGEISALVPSNMTEQRALQFDAGGLLPAEPVRDIGGARLQKIPTGIPTLAKIVSKRIRDLDDPVLLVHEPMLSENELNSFLGEEIRSEKVRFQKIDGQLYLAYESDIRTEERIAKAITSSMMSWHFLAFVTDRSHSASSVSVLLRHAKMILVGAYDGESALIWERRA